MNGESEALLDAVVQKLIELLMDDEAGWQKAAQWIDKLALENGIDLGAQFDSPEMFARSLVEGMRFHSDFSRRFPGGAANLDQFEVAEELFWHLMPN
jgi:hypothetical protein